MYGFEALTFNIDGGYLEAIVRGHRGGILTTADYNNLCQCESLDDIKMHLSATGYGPYLQNVPLRCVLRIYAAKGAGDQKLNVDFRMCGSESEVQSS